MSKNLRGLSERKGVEQNLFREIVKISGSSGEEKEEFLKKLSDEYLIGRSSFLGASSFYDFLKDEHIGKKVFICDGTACLTSGKQEKLKQLLLEYFSEDEIGSVTCLGHCHSNSAFMYGNETYSADDQKKLDELIIAGQQHSPNCLTGSNTENPPLTAKINHLEDYYNIICNYSGNFDKALKEIETSGLRGRGGAGFPFYMKLKATLNAVSKKKYVVCNADEGDPGAFSDKWLLEERPHLVLSGMMMSGLITGADTGVIYIRGEYPESIRAVQNAVKEFEEAGLADLYTYDTEIRFTFYVIEGAGAYICGEETSLLNSIEGLRPEVRTRPPFPAEYGLFGKPTLLSNVETFANIGYILREGGKSFTGLGTERSTGTKLVSLDGSFRKPGLYEVKMGTSLNIVFEEMGGGTHRAIKAYQIGGPLGGIVPTNKVKDLTLDFESFSSAGFLLGHAGVVSVPDNFKMISYLLHLFEFTSRESCGKCFPCRIGSEKGAELIKNALEKGEKIDRRLFLDLLETMELGSLCALGGGLPLPVHNALEYFSEELSDYFTEGK